MATQITTATTNASHVLTYQKAMHATNAIQIAKPTEDGLVMLRPQQLTRVETQAGKHYQLRQTDSNGKAQIPDDVIAVRHGDALHLRYADGSTASFENFFSVCTDESVCSVNLAGDTEAGFTLSGADGNGGVANGGIAAITATGGFTAYSSVSDNIGYSLLGGGFTPAPNTIVSTLYEASNELIANFNGDGFMDLSDGSTSVKQVVRLGTAGGISANATDSGIQKARHRVSKLQNRQFFRQSAGLQWGRLCRHHHVDPRCISANHFWQ